MKRRLLSLLSLIVLSTFLLFSLPLSAAPDNMNQVKAWGANVRGQLGDGTQENRSTPVVVLDEAGTGSLQGVVMTSVGSAHTLALDNDGNLWAWGSNESGQLGNTSVANLSTTPVKVMKGEQDSSGDYLENIVTLAAGQDFSVAVDNSGSVYAWGDNRNGQVGVGDTGTQYFPAPMKVAKGEGPGTDLYLEKITGVSAGFSFAVALDEDGHLWSWGSNLAGQLGNGVQGLGAASPVAVRDNTGGEGTLISNVAAVSAGAQHVVALNNDGSVCSWGQNVMGELGIGYASATEFRTFPVLVKNSAGDGNLQDIVDIAAGTFHNLAIGKDGGIWSWGNNTNGQCGAGSAAQGLPLPAAVLTDDGGPRFTGAISVSAGFLHSAAVTESGELYTWGGNVSGQLGFESPLITGGLPSDVPFPTRVEALTEIRTAVSAGYNQTVSTDSPVVISIEPEYILTGETYTVPNGITVRGLGFSYDGSSLATVYFDGVPVNTDFVSPTELTVEIDPPINVPSTILVTVCNEGVDDGRMSNAVPLKVYEADPPTITAISVNTVDTGQTVPGAEVTGTGFGTDESNLEVRLVKPGEESIALPIEALQSETSILLDSFTIPEGTARGDWEVSVLRKDTGQLATYTTPVIVTVTGGPIVYTGAATGVGGNSATFNGVIAADGGHELTNRGFQWRLKGSSDPWDAFSENNTTSGAFSYMVQGLELQKTYEFRAFAENDFGISYGEVHEFSTTMTNPSVTTDPVDGVTFNSATFNGTVTDTGGSDVTSFGFEYKLVDSGLWLQPAVKVETQSAPFSFSLNSLADLDVQLEAGKTYLVRAKATNSRGTAYAAPVEFTTPNALSVTTDPASYDEGTGVTTFSASLDSDAGLTVAQYGFQYREVTEPESPWISLYEDGPIAEGPFSLTTSALVAGTEYEYRAAVVVDQDNFAVGETRTYKVGTPTATTTDATAILGSGTDATLNGVISGVPADDYGFRWRVVGNGSWESWDANTAAADEPVSHILTGLIPGTEYEFQLFASNDYGTAYGRILFFVTQGPALVVTEAAFPIGSDEATLNAYIGGTGGEDQEVSERGFRWRVKDSGIPWESASVWSETAGAPYDLGAFSHKVTGLATGTTYEFRAFAVNDLGTAEGEVLLFTVGAPVVITMNADSITSAGATLKLRIVDPVTPYATTYGWEYREKGTDTWDEWSAPTGEYTAIGGSGNDGVYTRTFPGLLPGTTYEFRAFAVNSNARGCGETLEFTTLATAPAVSTKNLAAGDISETYANLKGSVDKDGGSAVIERGFEWRIKGSGTWTWSWSETGASFDVGEYIHAISTDPDIGFTYELGVTYEFRAYALNAEFPTTPSYGSMREFTAATVPGVVTDPATEITGTTAVFNGLISSTGGRPITTRAFRYRVKGATAWLGGGSAGSGPGAFNVTKTGLATGTTYEYQAHASNSLGTSYGEIVEFTTHSAPTVVTTAATDMTTSGATVNGNITSDGGADITVRGFYYREAGTHAWSNWNEDGPFAPGAFSHELDGLKDGTTYEYYAYATNAVGTDPDEPPATLTTFTTEAVPPVYKDTWYLAEGCSDYGFWTYVTIQNPNKSPITATVTYMMQGGTTETQQVSMFAESQLSINPTDIVGAADFSTKVVCDQGLTIAVDRTVIWTGPGAAASEAHNSIGVTEPSGTWYLPEGSSNWGFETWLLIQNPNSAPADCEITYMIEGVSVPTIKNVTIDGNSRATFSMLEAIGAQDASIMVESGSDIIAERAMYRNNRREGHDSIGATAPANTYYLAEGSSNWGFTTYVLVQNPNPGPNTVTVTYQTTTKVVEQDPFVMGPYSRKTIEVNSVPGMAAQDFSTRVDGTLPVIVERSMYWDNGTGEACTNSIGMSDPHLVFYFPDGKATADCETYTLVQNPNAGAVSVRITYMGTAGYLKVKTVSVPAHSRYNFVMAEDGIVGGAASMVETLDKSKPIMCERSMYWYNKSSGTDTIGGFDD